MNAEKRLLTWPGLKKLNRKLHGSLVYWINACGEKLLYGSITASMWADPAKMLGMERPPDERGEQ